MAGKIKRDASGRLADLLCFARKYESDSDAETIKRISINYLAALDQALARDKMGKDRLSPKIKD